MGMAINMLCINQEDALKVVAIIKNNIQPTPVYLWKENQTSNFDLFLENVFLSYAARDPQMLSKIGLFESMGIREHNAYLTHISPDLLIDNLREKKEILQQLHTYSNTTLSHDQKVSYDIVSWMLTHEIDGEKFLFHEYKINQLDGILFELALLFTQVHVLKHMYDIENYIARLEKIPHKINQTIQLLELQKNKKLLPPRFTVEKVITIIKKFLPENTTDHIFYNHLARHIVTINPAEKDIFLKKAHDVIEHAVYPAYQKLQHYFNNLLGIVHANHGVWALPQGDEYYAYMLKQHTTTQLSADEIHALGLQEMRKIQQAMRVLLAEYGMADANKDVGTLMQELSHNPEFYYPDTDAGREQCLCDYQNILERSRQLLAHLFDLKPNAGVKIQRIPIHEQEGMPAAYYHEPSFDGSRPGIFFVNLRNMTEDPKYRMETLTIHEAEPGHHFQIALQHEMQIPMLRKITFFTAYVEGWALYAEKLAYEQGFYSSSLEKLGHLQDELLRAVRLVIDTGIHYKRWSREQAIAYMQKELGYQYDSAVTEVERYFVLPGQACAYKIGQLKILELRDYAQKKLGKKFDIRAFHNVVLKVGNVPLTVLEDIVKRFVEEKLKELTF